MTTPSRVIAVYKSTKTSLKNAAIFLRGKLKDRQFGEGGGERGTGWSRRRRGGSGRLEVMKNDH